MCLNTKNQKFKPIAQKHPVIRYKIFRMVDHTPVFAHFKYKHPEMSSLSLIGVWLKAKTVTLYVDDLYIKNKAYQSGFHVFKTLETATDYMRENYSSSVVCIFKVLCKNVHTEGEQYDYTVQVADEMKVISKASKVLNYLHWED